MEPVRRTLVATWREEGSSEVAKMVEEFGGSSMGPSSHTVIGALFSVVVVVGSEAWAIHESCLARRWVGSEKGVMGLSMKLREGEERKRLC